VSAYPIGELVDALSWALDQIDDDPDPDHIAALAAARALVDMYSAQVHYCEQIAAGDYLERRI
jgi:hypothetical protein